LRTAKIARGIVEHSDNDELGGADRERSESRNDKGVS
jgi:hypothetical protein